MYKILEEVIKNTIPLKKIEYESNIIFFVSYKLYFLS
jgi:hypothetical protein